VSLSSELGASGQFNPTIAAFPFDFTNVTTCMLTPKWRSFLQVDGGAITVGHPYGKSGQRLTGHGLIEGRRRRVSGW